ncbi:MAG TPA: class I SAM-dependent methyltransferase [Methanomassiliicoccales archaeon]|nr:class I SAM-dependent methyltransferase [Methanomassiliicoccales archaeon]
MTKDQKEHWESIYRDFPERFGTEPSQIGLNALKMLIEEGARDVLELGCGQGRDTVLFLREGMKVIALDYSRTCLNQLKDNARVLGVEGLLQLDEHDIREGISLPDDSVDACFSHMFFTMQLTEEELAMIFSEALRVLRPGGLNIYSVRNTEDPHFCRGTHMGEDMWEMNGFVVHYFSEGKVRRLAEGYEIVSIEEFTEGPLPKRLYQVVLRKPM